MVYKEKDIHFYAKHNPWFKYIEKTLPKVKKWWKMTRKELTEELKKRKMPLQLSLIHI